MTTPSLRPLWLTVALVAVLLPLAGCASSQGAARDADRVAQTLAAINEAVDLTDAQTERIREILIAQEARRPSGPPRGGPGGQGGPPRGGDRDAQRAEADRQIEAVLTEEQVTAYREWRSSQPQRTPPPPHAQA